MEISSSTIIQASLEQVKTWFRTVSKEPKQYQFATHGGVVIISGRLDRPGAIFETREQFLGVTVGLQFRMRQVTADGFTFKLVKPMGSGRVFGQYLLKKLAPKTTMLTLRIFGKHPRTVLGKIQQVVVFFSPLRWAVRRQIRAEVEFIRQAVEKK